MNMKWFALLGLLLFLGVAIAPSINADVKEQDIVEPELVEEKFEKLVGLVEGVISYYERTYEASDCGCELEEPTPWQYPVICTLLFILNFPTVILFFMTMGAINLGQIIVDFAEELDCRWASY